MYEIIKTNNEEKNKNIYDKISFHDNYFYDSNKNLLKNNSPEDIHFRTITFLQKMKSNNKSIK